MNIIQIANILLTRRCNLRCNYCNIVQDYKGKPELYPTINDYLKNELPAEQWIDIFDRLVANNPNVFLILYGGEPFVYPGIETIIEHCNNKRINYTIISNNTDMAYNKALKIFKKLGPYRGFTGSVDPVIGEDDLDDAVRKSVLAIGRLTLIKNSGMAEDVVAEITCTSKNIHRLYDTVKMLSDRSIYSSITCIDSQKSNFYDFSSITDPELLVQKSEKTAKEFNRIIDDHSLLVHIPKMLLDLYHDLPDKMSCGIYNNVHNVTIDADGKFRLCLRIRGLQIPQLEYNNVITREGKITEQAQILFAQDYNSLCQRCNWTCMYFSKYYDKQILNH